MILAARATRIARAFGDRDPIAMGLMSEGMAHIAAGRSRRGWHA
jgi:hypothetical protein